MTGDQSHRDARDLVSVIVPVYRTERYLDDCVASIRAQTYPDLQVILVDDGSDDGAPALCDAWAMRDSRVRVLHRPNGGLSAARNSGLEIARGAWIMFVDSDDVISPHLIGTLHRLGVDNRADIAGCDLVPFQEEPPQFTSRDEQFAGPAQDVLLRLIRGGRNWEACSKLFHRDLFDRGLRFREDTIYEDLDLIPEVYLRATRAVHTRSGLYGYRRRPGSIMAESGRALSVDLISVLEANIDRARQRFPVASMERDQLTAAYILHASSKLEQMRSLRVLRNNADYVRAYRRFVRRHAREIMRSSEISRLYRWAIGMSAISPHAFVAGVRLASWSKARFAPSISRRTSDG